MVWDADKIDLLGTLGIVRVFHLRGNRPFDSVVERAFKELTAIYPLLNTKTARALAKKRHHETMIMLKALKKELSLEDLEMSEVWNS